MRGWIAALLVLGLAPLPAMAHEAVTPEAVAPEAVAQDTVALTFDDLPSLSLLQSQADTD